LAADIPKEERDHDTSREGQGNRGRARDRDKGNIGEMQQGKHKYIGRTQIYIKGQVSHIYWKLKIAVSGPTGAEIPWCWEAYYRIFSHYIYWKLKIAVTYLDLLVQKYLHGAGMPTIEYFPIII